MPITAHVARALGAALGYAPEHLPEIERALTEPPSLALGDLAFPCFQLARQLRAAPAKIAADLASRITADTLIERAVAQGPYVNLYLDRAAAARQVLGAIAGDPERYGSRNLGGGQVIVLDFSAPNIAKPFHFGHLRSTNIGADLARIFSFLGYRVVRKNYIGDWGTQFGFVIYAWQKWGDLHALRQRAIEYLVELYVRAYKESETDPGVREQARHLFLRLEQGDPDIAALWQQFRELSLAGFMRTYERLGIGFDSYEGEASVNHLVEAVIERFRRASVAVESEGALVVPVSDVLGRELAPMMLRKSDGASTYAARDCAEALDRFERYGFSANIYVVSRQEDHFAQVFAALGKLAEAEGWESRWPQTCENVSFGYVRGMSTRKGEAVWLEDVLDEARDRARRVREEKSAANPRAFPELPEEELERISESVGQAALLYFDVSSRRMSDITFDWDSVLQFEGNTGPYLQYCHARMCGIFRKAAAQGLATTGGPAPTPATLADEEWALVLVLRGFGAAVERAAEGREPHEISQYLHTLASAFNAFYNRHTVIDGAEPLTTGFRLELVGAAQAVLASGLRLLGIRSLELM
ncbi:MAG: arginine--tRNA ligase [Gammaproteobacteria bacterium]|nr:arginine--tRNA ligase [Gammaproteobacteria bacterium]